MLPSAARETLAAMQVSIRDGEYTFLCPEYSEMPIPMM